MTAERPAFTISILAFLFMGAFGLQPDVKAQEQTSQVVLTDEEIERLIATSAPLEDQIQTVRMRLKCLTYIGLQPKVTSKQVIEVIGGLEGRLNSGGFEALRQAMAELLSKAGDPHYANGGQWIDLQLIQDGSRIRNVWTKQGVLLTDAAFDGVREVEYRAGSKQADIYTGRSNIHLVSIEELRRPAPKKFETYDQVSRQGRVERLAGNRFRINIGDQMHHEIDQTTGLITGFAALTRNEASIIEKGRIEKYLQITEYPGEIAFPDACLQFEFDSGKWRFCRAYVIEEAQFNVSVNDEDFEVAVPAEVVVVRDDTTPGRETIKLAAKSPNILKDIRAFPDYEPSANMSWMSLVLFTLGLAVLICGVGVWRLARKSP